MKKLIIIAGALFSVVTAAQIVAQMTRSRRCIDDPRWQEAVASYKAARERNAPQVEIDRAKQEVGRVFSRLQAEQA